MADSIDRLKGKVRWFDIRRGFGFITPEDGGDDVFVHKSSINAVGYSSLTVGDFVEFVVTVSDDGRSKAVNVTGPDGACIKGRRYFGGACYRCGEVGHMLVDCKRDAGSTRLGPCYSCGEIGHLSRECPYRFNQSNLNSISPISVSIPIDLVNGDGINLVARLSEKKIICKGEESSRRMEERNWAELTRDVLSVIFKKLDAVGVITSAQYVCRPWRQFSKEPELWRCIDMTNHASRITSSDLESIAMMVVDRSDGCVEEFSAAYFGTDVLMGYLAGRATQLRCLRLSAVHQMTDMALVQAVRRFRRLEELEISRCFFSHKVVELVGLACPHIQSFKLYGRRYNFKNDFDTFYNDFEETNDKVAMSIANNMQQLRCLKLLENRVTNFGLSAILNSCPHLEYLDIGGCLNVQMDENMKKKCARIKDLRLPTDFTSDYLDYDSTTEGLEMYDEDVFVPTVFATDLEDYQYDDYAYYDHDGFFDANPDYIL